MPARELAAAEAVLGASGLEVRRLKALDRRASRRSDGARLFCALGLERPGEERDRLNLADAAPSAVSAPAPKRLD